MRALQENDFDQMATRVVDRFMQGSKLADAATDEAMGGQLTPDQIERMVQAANTMAFLRLMEEQKAHAGGGPDMTREFDPIDTRQIIQQIMGNVAVPHMDAPHDEPDGDEGPLPALGGKSDADDEEDDAPPIDDDNDGPFPKGEKQKSKEKAAPKKEPPKAPAKDEAKEAAFRTNRQRKLASIMEDQYKQAEWAFEDAFVELRGLLKRASGAPKMDAFEKDALALYPDAAGLVVLNMTRTAFGYPEIDGDTARAKHAALADRHVVDDYAAIRAFGRLVKIATEASRLQEGVQWLRSQCS